MKDNSLLPLAEYNFMKPDGKCDHEGASFQLLLDAWTPRIKQKLNRAHSPVSSGNIPPDSPLDFQFHGVISGLFPEPAITN